MFFVGTVDPGLGLGPYGIGPLNISPKGGTPLHVITPTRVAYLDYAGSGDETARHLSAGGPITLMVCSFGADDAAIVRLYGRGETMPLEESLLAGRLLAEPATELRLPMRQVIDVAVERTATACGYGVPVLELVRQRRVADRGRRYKESR
jgi:hypothetical protein